MKNIFDNEKIIRYLNIYKDDLSTLYKWNSKIDKLVELEILTNKKALEINSLSPFEKEVQLKKIVGKELKESHGTNKKYFESLCWWIIEDWGRIKASEENTKKLINDLYNQKKSSFERIASFSKIEAYMFPEKKIIYDSRVAYSLNWIILSKDAGKMFFPLPPGRNKKMSAFDISVLIRLKNISNYEVSNISQMEHRQFMNNNDKKIFINKEDAYDELNKLILQIHPVLWKDDKEKEKKLFYTEMLLFSIADKEIVTGN